MELREQHPPHDALRSPPMGLDSSSCKTATVGPWEPTIKKTGCSVHPADVTALVSRWLCEAAPDPRRLHGTAEIHLCLYTLVWCSGCFSFFSFFSNLSMYFFPRCSLRFLKVGFVILVRLKNNNNNPINTRF